MSVEHRSNFRSKHFLRGIWTGIASFFGVFMNLNYILAGAMSANPKLGLMALFLVLTRHIGGYYGLDRYVLPLLGTPRPATLLSNRCLRRQ
jgi:thiosulfate dehydrogenase [quinone] large subunit